MSLIFLFAYNINEKTEGVDILLKKEKFYHSKFDNNYNVYIFNGRDKVISS